MKRKKIRNLIWKENTVKKIMDHLHKNPADVYWLRGELGQRIKVKQYFSMDYYEQYALIVDNFPPMRRNAFMGTKNELNVPAGITTREEIDEWLDSKGYLINKREYRIVECKTKTQIRELFKDFPEEEEAQRKFVENAVEQGIDVKAVEKAVGRDIAMIMEYICDKYDIC